MPSTTSSSVSAVLASSAVMTPSLPTFCIACASIWPISVSPLAEMVPICAISSLVETFLARACRSLTTASTARSTPRLRSIGFMPAATDLAPSFTIAWASTVAVVVPSPATVLVLLATSRTIWAPMFSNLSDSSISFATVTPSLVTRGAPKLLSSTTLRPLGPSVTFTALARMSTPRSILSRASTENLTSLAAMFGCPVVFIGRGRPRSAAAATSFMNWICVYPGEAGTGSRASRDGSLGGLLAGNLFHQHSHDVAFLHDEILGAVDLHFGARPLAEQHAITGLDVDRNELAGLVAPAGADGDDFALLRLFLSGVGDDDAAGGLFLGINALDDDAIVKRTKLHRSSSL